jgi:Flp pilus assembly protein TadG
MLARNTSQSKSRHGAALVEFAVVLSFVLTPTLIGVWEVGRLIQVQQIVANSAREGARLASQAVTIGTDGTRTQISATTGTPNVRRVIYQYLVLNGLPELAESDVTTSFKFLTGAQSGNTSADPWMGKKGDRFEVNVSIPFNKVRWVNLGIVNPSTVSFNVRWTMLVDDPFTIDPTLLNW